MSFIFMSIIFLIVRVSTIPTFTNSTSKQEGLFLNLIHRDLIVQDHNPNVMSLNETFYHEEEVGSLRTKGANFYVEVHIGSKMVRQYLAFSTNSPFIWVQCAGDRSHGGNPLFNPGDSHSYTPSTCFPTGDRYCKRVPGVGGHTGGRCDEHYRCEYTFQYKDGTSSKGFIGFDAITFYNAQHAPSRVPKVLFGCGMDRKHLMDYADGVFGLGGIRELSILDTMSKKFSFCFGSLSDQHYENNHLALGNDAKLRGVPVSFTVKDKSIMVELYGITFGTQRIDMHNALKFTIDSMSTFSYISRDIQNKIREKVERAIGNKIKRAKPKKLDDALCYASTPAHISHFPELILNLYHHTIHLDVNSLFWKVSSEDAFCLSFRPSPDNNDNVIGATALQHHNVGFDMVKKLVYFEKIDCRSVVMK